MRVRLRSSLQSNILWRGPEVAVKRLFPDFFCSNRNGVALLALKIETLSRQIRRFVLRPMGACLDPPDPDLDRTGVFRDYIEGMAPRSRELAGEEVGPFATVVGRGACYREDCPGHAISSWAEAECDPQGLEAESSWKMRYMFESLTSDFTTINIVFHRGTYVYMVPEVIRCEPYERNAICTALRSYPYIETGLGPGKIAFEVAD
ncbi:hypothetical protein MLD38_014207 [Melastoma candidum]|uniref:Uncharacterized protein n=1 Tax=Melastoma candidum TaxID=119954 RepID=A0ACB9RF51_9MYRT|nr:hypothetical protein MLD38_014207 [Melastoma candidum]